MSILESAKNFITGGPRFLGPLVLMACFLIGVILFFPIQNFESKLNSALSSATGQDVKVKQTSLSNGLLRGGLVSLNVKKLEIFMPHNNAQIDCHDVEITPVLLSIFMLQLKAIVSCGLDKDSKAVITATASAPVWAISELTTEVELENVSLDQLSQSLKIKGLSGTLEGTVEATQLSAGAAEAQFAWDLTGAGLSTPPVRSDFFNLPSLKLDKMASEGELRPGRLDLKDLELGVQGKQPLWLKIQADFGLDRQRMPTSGTLTGKIQTDPAFELEALQDLNLDLVFGKVKPSGMREFKKQVQGNALSLLMSPPME